MRRGKGGCGKDWSRCEGFFTEKLWSRAHELFPAALLGPQRTWDIPVQPDVAQHLIGLLRQSPSYSLSRMAEIATAIQRSPAD